MQKRKLRRKYKRITGSKLIQFRIGNDEHKKLKQQASKLGLPMAAYARMLCMQSKGVTVNC
tara:strand:+ start:358 stop:540 length:183 start_codon:yes stop_codon:yes gene_type:complete